MPHPAVSAHDRWISRFFLLAFTYAHRPRGLRRFKGRLNEKQLVLYIAETALDKRALNIEIIDVSEHVEYTDYVMVCSGRSERQIRAIAEAVEGALKELGVKVLGVEGKQGGQWVLMDFGSVIVHIFLEKARGYYDIEGLWIDAARVPFDEARARAAGE